MHRSSSIYAPQAASSTIGTEIPRSVTVTLTREEQERVNRTRRQGTTSKTIRRHNSNINRIITFVKEKVTNGTIQLNSTTGAASTIDSIIQPINLDTVRDKEAYAMEKNRSGNMIYRKMDFIWNNFPQEAFELYMEQEHVKYHLVKDQVTNQPTIKLNAQNKPIVKTFDTQRKLYNAIEGGV